MNRTIIAFLKRAVVGTLSVIFCSVPMLSVSAIEGDFSVSPMNQKIVLTPGETYTGSFKIGNPGTSSNDFAYKAIVMPFYVSEDYEPSYENNGDYSQIADWIKVDNPEGVIAPNNVVELDFSINVPENAPAGGQYAAIIISSNSSNEAVEKAINIDTNFGVTHVIYAEVAGTTERHGEVMSTDVPSFLLSGNITGSSAVKNTGNVHGTAKYTLQVFPLFSGEEIYTNEETPLEKTILPDRTLYNEISWEETPPVGIFNVIYTVEFEGVTTQVSKMVIICPIWLLFIIIFAIFALIFYFVAKSKSRKKVAKE